LELACAFIVFRRVIPI